MSSIVPSIADRRLRPRGRYLDASQRPRELVAYAGAAGSVLVIDRDARTRDDRRLVAKLAPDEPPGNVRVVCRCYLSDPARVLPRRVTVEDLLETPAIDATIRSAGTPVAFEQQPADLVDSDGCRYRLTLVPASAIGIPELRWLRQPPAGQIGPGQVVSLRDVIGRMQTYRPSRAMTVRAVARHHADPHVSVATLRAEHERVARSRIVLNRGLREAVVRVVEQDGVSMSCIAARCGRVKRDRRGNLSGETSWLARRLGLAPEGGGQRPTPWIHTEVLALIARDGLGVAPREVELA